MERAPKERKEATTQTQQGMPKIHLKIVMQAHSP
jgi:hypothetical protein